MTRTHLAALILITSRATAQVALRRAEPVLVPAEFRWTALNVMIVPDTNSGVGVLLVTTRTPLVFHDQRFAPAEAEAWVTAADSLLLQGPTVGSHPVTLIAQDSSMLVMAWESGRPAGSAHSLLAYYPPPDTGNPKSLVITLDPPDAHSFLDSLRTKATASRMVLDTNPSRVVPLGLVQEKPAVLSGPPPYYPVDLRRQGMQGSVLAQMIVDTAGRVEPDSYRTIMSPDPEFTAAARDCLLRTRFRPARINHQPVRVLVEIPVNFTLGRG